ncbi:MAG: ATP-binding protein [Candidatus Krumholzibacteriota bacterium]|nr:ATP-binding protein [Candidatus Krumholzibacteriota bacterium]
MNKKSLYILNLAPDVYSRFFSGAGLPDDIDVKVYKTFPGFMKGFQARTEDSPNIIMFLRQARFDCAKARSLRLSDLDSPIYIVSDSCDEKTYLMYLSMGINGIITPPFSKVDVHAVLNGRSERELLFPRNNDLIKEGQVRLDFLVPSKLSRILGVNRLVSFLATEFGFPSEECRVNLPMVMDEALSNAIEHGNNGNEELKVHVRIYISSSRIIIQVEDQGDGFIPENIDDPRDQENIYKGSGRGIYLIKEIMDKVTFRKGGRLIEIEKINPLSS